MSQKVVLILVDGMRPDGIEQCKNPYLVDLKNNSTYCFHATTVMPSVTLPCHTSLFTSVDPERHGILTNNWVPMARPIDSLGDVVAKAGKKAAMFYNWEELRDLNRPGSLQYSHFQTGYIPHQEAIKSEVEMTKKTITYIQKEQPDFVFLYLGHTDEAGHAYGWMRAEYLESISNASDCIQMLINALSDEYSVIITADHGGHGRNHGEDCPEDMTIPMIFHGLPFKAGRELQQVNIKDIAPTITEVLNIAPAPQWEGVSILND